MLISDDIGVEKVFSFSSVGKRLVGYYLGSCYLARGSGRTLSHLFGTPEGTAVVRGMPLLIKLLEGVSSQYLIQLNRTKNFQIAKGLTYYVYEVKYHGRQGMPKDKFDVFKRKMCAKLKTSVR